MKISNNPTSTHHITRPLHDTQSATLGASKALASTAISGLSTPTKEQTINPAFGRLNHIAPTEKRTNESGFNRLTGQAASEAKAIRLPLNLRIINFPPFGSITPHTQRDSGTSTEKTYGDPKVTLREALNTLLGGLSKHRKLAFVEFINDLRNGQQNEKTLSYNDFGHIRFDRNTDQVEVYVDTDAIPDTTLTVPAKEFFDLVNQAQQAFGNNLNAFVKPANNNEIKAVNSVSAAISGEPFSKAIPR